MIDYLEEHLSNAETLLKRIRQLEQSVSGLSHKTALKENVTKTESYDEKKKKIDGKSDIESKGSAEVYNTEGKVNRIKREVDNLGGDLEMRGKEQDIVVNDKIKMDYNSRNLEHAEINSKGAEKQTNTERAESRLPLSVQLNELDRAVSVLTTLLPEGQGTAQSSYPISLSAPRSPAADPNFTGVPDKGWGGSGAPAGAGFTYGEAQSWTEQADRMFRRDSRRYDGGFYLY